MLKSNAESEGFELDNEYSKLVRKTKHALKRANKAVSSSHLQYAWCVYTSLLREVYLYRRNSAVEDFLYTYLANDHLRALHGSVSYGNAEHYQHKIQPVIGPYLRTPEDLYAVW